MSVMSNFENKIEGAVDGAAAAMFSSPIEPAQIAKKAEKQMKREKLVGSGRQHAPTLYSVLVNERDDKRLFGFYPTMASEIENYLYAKGTEAGMEFDTRPLVRFIPDPGLKKGRFDVIAEVVSAPIIKKLRDEELEYYGLAPKESAAPEQRQDFGEKRQGAGYGAAGAGAGAGIGTGAGMDAADANYNRGAAGLKNPSPLVSERFAGLDTPANIPASAELLPLSVGRERFADVAKDRPEQNDRVNELLNAVAPSGAPAVASPAVALPAAAPAAMAPAATHNAPRASAFDAAATREPSAHEAALESMVLGSARLFSISEQRQYRLEHRKLTVGRGKENDIILSDANASRVHARFSQDATGKWKLTDLGSTNGTLLNGRPVSSAILRSGDEVTIGTTVLKFSE